MKGDQALEQMVTLFRLMKLTRVRRLSKLIQNLNWPVETKSQLKRIYIVFLLALVVHILGCSLFWLLEVH